MFTGKAKYHPGDTTGVNGFAVIGLLHLFDLVWDICGDMMHCVMGFFKTHLIPIMKREQQPKPPPVPAKTHADGSPWTEEESEAREAAYKKAKERKLEQDDGGQNTFTDIYTYIVCLCIHILYLIFFLSFRLS
jgi:hypothetical protein